MLEKTYKIYTLGCKVNQYDSAALSKYLQLLGWQPVNNNAGMAIINTCAVTQAAIRKDRRMINKARKENQRAKIMVIGCWPRTYFVSAKEIGADFIFPRPGEKEISRKINSETDKEVKQFLEYLSKKIIKKGKKKNGRKRGEARTGEKQKERSSFKEISPLVVTSRSRYFLKIQDGCNQFCSYCLIPYARGRLRSRPAGEIIKEARAAAGAGFAEIVLTGIHLGLYGVDRYQGKRLADLIKEILKIKDLGRLRLSSIEVTEVSRELIKLLAINKKLCPHLHIPLQSASNRILRLMNRPYRRSYFKKKIISLRRFLPEIAITSDVMVGFPGETEKDFQETYDFIQEIKFSRLHVFPFSSHPQTSAAQLPDYLEQKVIEARAEKLRRLSEQLKNQYQKKFKGQELAVIVENYSQGQFKGKAAHYFNVYFSSRHIVNGSEIKPNNLIGRLVKVKKWEFA